MSQVTRELLANQFVVRHHVDPKLDGIRLDAFLKQYYRRRSREQIKRAIESGSISVIREQSPHLSVGRLKPSSPLVPGDSVLITSKRKPEPEVNFDYRILHQDDSLFVIDKPGNLPVHPAGRFFFNTLLTHLRTEGFTRPLDADREFFLAHRIDRETSGVLVLTRTAESCAAITEQFSSRTTEKRYLAIVHGEFPHERIDIDAPMSRVPGSRIALSMHVQALEEGGLPALTRVHRLGVIQRPEGRFSLVECFPKTGRQHQIRVHLAHIGHPIVGDKIYSLPENQALRLFEPDQTPPPDPLDDTTLSSSMPFSAPRYIPAEIEAKLILPRHALHAAGIRLKNPTNGRPMEFHSALPEDLRQFWLNVGSSDESPANVHPSDWKNAPVFE